MVADDDRIDGRYLEVHQGILSLLATQAPVAGDLRVVAALLHVIRCVERMGDQCVNIAKLVPLSGYEAPKDEALLAIVERMGALVLQQVGLAKQTFGARDVGLAETLWRRRRDRRLNREVFQRAVEPATTPRCASGPCSWCSWDAPWSASATTPWTWPSRPCSWSAACSGSWTPAEACAPVARRARPAQGMFHTGVPMGTRG